MTDVRNTNQRLERSLTLDSIMAVQQGYSCLMVRSVKLDFVVELKSESPLQISHHAEEKVTTVMNAVWHLSGHGL